MHIFWYNDSVVNTDRITVIIGQTASGKSNHAVTLANKHHSEIISADAFQIYKGFNIGTATPTITDMGGITHHLINELSPTEPYSIQQFLDRTKTAISNIQAQGKSVIICGGSALYIRALLYGYQPLKRLPKHERPTGSPMDLWNRLYTIDPDLAKKTPHQNKVRVQRYLELAIIYNKPPSTLFKQHDMDTKKYQVIGQMIDQSILRKRIRNRTEQMVMNGLIDEVSDLMKQYPIDCPAFTAIGYNDIAQCMTRGDATNTMIDIITKKTIHYAKRQRTWFNAFNHVQWMDA